MRVLVTGANGFVGSAVCLRLVHEGFYVRPVARTVQPAELSVNLLPTIVAHLEHNTDWSAALDGVTAG